MKYSVIGTRDFNGKIYDNKEYIASVLSTFKDLHCLVSGGGKGIESLAQNWAISTNKQFELIPPNIKLHGSRDAFLHRDIALVDASDSVIIFWDGIKNISLALISSAIKSKKTVHIFPLQ